MSDLKTEFKTLSIRKKDSEKLSDLARLCGKSKAQLLHDYIEALEQLICLFPNGCSLNYYVTVLENTLTIEASGKLGLKIGERKAKKSDDK